MTPLIPNFHDCEGITEQPASLRVDSSFQPKGAPRLLEENPYRSGWRPQIWGRLNEWLGFSHIERTLSGRITLRNADAFGIRSSSPAKRVSSIPETLMIEPISRGVLDTPHARGMTICPCFDDGLRYAPAYPTAENS